MKKRALSLLLVFAMILSFVPTTALAAGGEENEITISETPSTDNQEGEPSTSNDSVEPVEGDAVGTANTEDQTDSETGSDAEALSAGTARDGETTQRAVLESGDIDTQEKLQTAVDCNTSGTDQLKLTANIDVTDFVWVDRSFTLDLNGHTITYTEGEYCPFYMGPESAIDVTIKNGSIIVDKDSSGSCGIWVNDYVRTLNLENVKITNNSTYAGATGVTICHSYDATLPTTIVNVTNCTITGDGGIFVNGSTGSTTAVNNTPLTTAGIILNIDAKSTVVSNGANLFAAISGNGNDCTNPSITIAGTIEGGKTDAIYLPQYGTTTVKAGAKISGHTGIGMKSGKLRIEGGTITGTGDYVPKPETYGNGIKSDGAAVFLESYAPPYAGKMEITIGKDATLTSNESYALRENPNSQQTAIESITIEDGAKLNASASALAITTPIDVLAAAASKITINGGTYSHPVKYAYLKPTDRLWQAGDGPYTYYSSLDKAKEAGEAGVTERIEAEDATDPLITLNYNNGGEGNEDFAVSYRIANGDPFTFPADPITTQTTKVFAGWRNDTTTSDTKLYKAGDVMPSVTKKITLTATWSDKKTEVEFVFDETTENKIDVKSGSTGNLTTETENSKTIYRVDDKTKDVTFEFAGTVADTKVIEAAYRIGNGATRSISLNESGKYVLPASAFSGSVSKVTVLVSLVDKKTVTFDFSELTSGSQTAPSVDLTDIEDANLTPNNGLYYVNDKTKSAKFKLKDGDKALKYTVKYQVDKTDTKVTLEPENGVYTLPADLEDNVTVTVTATAKNTITLQIDEATAKSYVASIAPATEGSNLGEKDSTTSPKVYVANDDTKSISFTVTAKADAQPEAGKGIVVKYKLATEADSAYTPLSAQSISSDKKTYTYTLEPGAIKGNIIVTVFVDATPVYTAEPDVHGSTTVTTITETQVSANIAAAQAQDEPLTIDASTTTTTVTKSEVTLGGDVVKAIVDSTTSTETNVDLAVKTNVGTVELPSETVSQIVKDNELTASDPLTVKVENQDDQIVGAIAETGATNLFDVTLMSGTKEVNAEDLGLTLRITLSFTIEIGLKNPKLYRFEDGKGIELSDVRYDPTTGKISGKTDHLSQFYVVIAPDTTIHSILGNGVDTKGTGGVSAPEAVIVQVPSGEGQPTSISSTNILTTDENAKVALYSNSTFTTPASSKTLNDGPNVVYATVTNGGEDNKSTSYYTITVIKEVAATDCSLESVLDKVVNTGGGSGSQADPYIVTVVATATELQASDIVANSDSATVKLYTSGTFNTAVSGNVTLAPVKGIATVYATVTNGSKTVYYQIQVTGDAITKLTPLITTDNNNNNKVDAGQATTGATRKYSVVTTNPESEIASWNTAMTEQDANNALEELGESGSVLYRLETANPPRGLVNDKYVVVADIKDGKIVAAGSVKIQLPVTVSIDATASKVLTVANGAIPITSTNNKVSYGTNLTLTLSDANYVVYANGEVVSMNGTNGTYKVKGITTFTVAAAWPVTLTYDPASELEVTYDNDGNGDRYVVEGTNMVPQNATLTIKQKGAGDYILMVNGERKDLSNTTSATVDVKAATTIEVVPAYKVTIEPNDVPNVILTVEVDGTTIDSGELVTKDTELTITFIHGANDTHKVQINGKDVTFSSNTAVHTVTANTTIEVVSQDKSSVVDELNVAVSTSGDVTVMNGSTPVTDAKFILKTKLPLPELTDDLTEDEVLTKLGESSYLDRALTASDSDKYLVAVQFSEDGNLIAAGISGKITVSSPTTTTGYKVSGTVDAGTTDATVAGILVTLKGADVTKTTTVKADGTYEFVGVDAGTYTVAIALNAASKYDAIDKEVVVDSDETVDITLVVLDPSTWEALTINSDPIGTTDRATFTVSNIKAGMYYSITISTDDTVPSEQIFQAEKNSWSFATRKDSTITVMEFGDEVKFTDIGMHDPTNPATRTKDYTAE